MLKMQQYARATESSAYTWRLNLRREDGQKKSNYQVGKELLREIQQI